MTPAASPLSRRDFFSRLVPTRGSPASVTAVPRSPGIATAIVALIAGRDCLAYQSSFCSVCRERCPVTGAVIVERGIPRIDPALCNGCRICHEVCPAPRNAIRLMPRPAALPNPSARGSALG